MDTALIAVLGVALAGLFGIVQFQLAHIRAELRDLRRDFSQMRKEVAR
ncbi:MAG TPA: hypothetical protein VG476_13975 [Acidimicrobiales bacterium]|nr:hypothetical protein [Acidimicrobiales bacterium]